MMKSNLLSVLCALLVFAGCVVRPPNTELPTLLASLEETLTPVAADDASALRWPQFLLSVRGGLLWADRADLLQVKEIDGRLIVEGPVFVETTLGLDRLIAGARGPFGEMVILDSSGRVSIRDQIGRVSGFVAELSNRRASSVAIAGRSVYLLVEGDVEGEPAVLQFSFAGDEEGRWGQMPADGFLQSVLRGGGLATCPNGDVFYSYINSAQLTRLAEGGRVELIGNSPSSFAVLDPRDVRRAFNEGINESSTKPLLQLSLGASRVMALFCTSESLLFRQVTGPGEGTLRIEVWDPAVNALVASLPLEEGVLLAVEDGFLYLGVLEEDRFELRKYRYELGDAPHPRDQ